VAVRFFVLAAGAAAILIYGIGRLAYSTGSFAIGAAALSGPGLGEMRMVGLLLTVLGVAFELALVPSHFGTLGLCFAAPLSCVTFAMTVSKAAAAFALARLVATSPQCQAMLVGLATITIVWAGLAGWAQRNLRGLLAYSAIGHGGFLALTVGCGPTAYSTLSFYIVVYVFSVALVFAALTGADADLPLSELGSRRIGRTARAAMVLGLLSLAGVPPGPGFLAKIAVLSRAWGDAGHLPTILCVLGAVFGAVVYLRPIPDLAAGLRTDETRPEVPMAVRLVIAVAGVVTLLCLIAPRFAMSMMS
jgi:NADH-quinone oxidoreductase subunit N